MLSNFLPYCQVARIAQPRNTDVVRIKKHQLLAKMERVVVVPDQNLVAVQMGNPWQLETILKVVKNIRENHVHYPWTKELANTI